MQLSQRKYNKVVLTQYFKHKISILLKTRQISKIFSPCLIFSQYLKASFVHHRHLDCLNVLVLPLKEAKRILFPFQSKHPQLRFLKMLLEAFEFLVVFRSLMSRICQITSWIPRIFVQCLWVFQWYIRMKALHTFFLCFIFYSLRSKFLVSFNFYKLLY